MWDGTSLGVRTYGAEQERVEKREENMQEGTSWGEKREENLWYGMC